MNLSLRSRLLFLLLAATLAVWACTAFFVYRDARHEVDELFDAQLAQTARLLLRQARATVEEDDDEIEIEAEELREHLGHHYEQKVFFAITDRQGDLLLTSSRSQAAASPLAQEPGFSTAELEAHPWRFFTLRDDRDRFRITVGQRLDIRGELATRIAVQVLHPLAIFLPLFGALIWFSVGRALRPLKDLTRAVSRREPRNLSPVELNPPAEVAPLVGALNNLLERIGDALERERRFTADAAHELRTPLAALSTHVQLAESARSEAERKESMAFVAEGLERMTRLVQQLLTLARMDPMGLPKGQQAYPAEIVRDVIARLAPLAVTRNQDITFETDSQTAVRGDATLLEVLAGNLVENAIRYTPPGGEVRVGVYNLDGKTVLRVQDSGPGVPPEALPRLGERFFRVLGTGTSGSGLGLSIVNRIAELHGAALSFETPPEGGLRVEVSFRPA